MAPSLLLFREHNPRLGGIILVWGAQVVIWGDTAPECPRGVVPAASLCSLSNCNYSIFVKEILLEIGFIQEMRTTWGNKEAPQTFSHNFISLQKHNLIRLTPYHCQPCLHTHFCDITKGKISQKFLQTKKRDYQLVAVSRPATTKSENMAIVTGTCKARLPVGLLIYGKPFVMSQNCENQGCQWY